jgi:hypothetical protein
MAASTGKASSKGLNSNRAYTVSPGMRSDLSESQEILRRIAFLSILSYPSPSVPPLYWSPMDIDRIIDEIQQLEEIFEAPDIRPLSASDISAANRRHDEILAHSPWFRLWQRYGVCCRVEDPVLQLPGGNR